jgi:hypothetical protein
MTDDGGYTERLVCHARLPLVAGLDSRRPAIQVWECGSGGPSVLAVIDSDAPDYPAQPWLRSDRVPAVAWHPHEPRLLITGEAGLREWAPSGRVAVNGAPANAVYRYVAYSPDGRTVWAFPSSVGGDVAWDRSDTIDPASGALQTAPPWDTGVAEHPGGGLLVTLCSNQGATLAVFGRSDDGSPSRLRMYRHALILDVDGYETPVFSPDGRFLAIRGNAYGNYIKVFEFPSLRRVLHMPLGEPMPSYPPPTEWMERMRSWSRHNIAFAARSGALLVGTPRGTIVEIDLDGHRAVDHDVPDGGPVTALAVLATGDLVVASRTGELRVLAEPGRASTAVVSDAQERVARFVDATSELPDDADLATDLVLTDGERTWDPDGLATLTEATASDPAWLQIQAVMNRATVKGTGSTR